MLNYSLQVAEKIIIQKGCLLPAETAF